MKFCSLYSGSSGNCLFVSQGSTRLLIDAGLSGKKIENALREIEELPEKISGIMVTHEHRDHILGIGILARRYHLPVYANEKTWVAMQRDVGRIDDIHVFDQKKAFDIGDLQIKAFPISHDAADPVGFVIENGSHSIGIVTDTGIVTPEIVGHIYSCRLAVIESNHDEGMVETGPYPYPLKRRILSAEGHLSNEAASELACELLNYGAVRHIVLAHLSEQNNFPYLANQTTESALRAHGKTNGISLEVAKRHGCGHLYQI